MDFLKRNILKQIMSYNNNKLNEEAKDLGYLTIYSSSYLARIALNQFKDIVIDYKYNNSTYNGFIKNESLFIDVRFLEYGYNYIDYFNDNLLYLNDSIIYFKKNLLDTNIGNELSIFNLYSTLIQIDNILDYAIKNNITNIKYDIYYYYFFDELDNLSKIFKTFITHYISDKFNINFNLEYKNIKELINTINDKNTLEKLEYYNLFKNDLSFEKILDSLLKQKNINIDNIISQYNISKRTAEILFNEYSINNNLEKQNEEIIKLIKYSSKNIEILEEDYIRGAKLYISSKTSKAISDNFKNLVFQDLLDMLEAGYYNEEFNLLINDVLKQKDNDKRLKLLAYKNKLDSIGAIDYSNKDNKDSLIKEFIDKIDIEDEIIKLKLKTLRKII